MNARTHGVFAALAATLLACEPPVVKPPDPPPPVDECVGLPPITASVVPSTVRVNGAATASGQGGSGRFRYTLSTNQSGGQVSGDRYIAGPTPGTDVITVADDCGNAGTTSVTVLAAFDVQPTRATVRPGQSFTIAVQGLKGTAVFVPQQSPLPSGGSITAAGVYTAGPTEARDLIVVKDSLTGDQALVQYRVMAGATFRAEPAKYALPTGTMVPLRTADGSGVVDWVVTGGGSVEKVGGVDTFKAPATAGTTRLAGTDRFTRETVNVSVRVLTELTRPNNPAQGRRSDTAAIVTGDFDGDGIEDVALGVPENDLNRPQGGAVFIFKGSAAGLPAEPTWTITGQTDTAQFGTVMAAGDLDGDGRADLAISAPGDDVTVADSGAVYLYSIGADGPQPMRGPLTGLGRGNFGAALAIADIDGDGDNDLVVGSPGADIAPGAGFTARGVIDIFVLQRGQPVPDLGTIRLSGWDLAADGATRRFSNLRAGRGLVAADLNGDNRVDIAFLTTVNNTLLGGMPVARAVTAVQVHFGRDSATKHFEDEPDLFVLPANTADGDEGNWRLGMVRAMGSVPTMLVAVADRIDSPNLSMMGGTAGGSNAGGALLFNLGSQRPTGTSAGVKPVQVGRTDAASRLFGDQAGIQSGRSFTVADVDGDMAPELVLGAPYATVSTMVGGMMVSLPNAGRILVFKLGALAAGAQVNKPDFSRAGANRTDVLGTGVAAWGSRIVAYNGRASTTLGDFTGRLDAFSGTGDLATWTVASASIPSKPASQAFGAGIEVGPLEGALRAIVGVPAISGPSSDNSGNETGAGQAVLFDVASPAAPRVVLEGANTPYVRDGGWPAFGGRAIGTDVAMTDFDGDGRQDLVIAAPNFSTPTLLADGGASVPDYALNRAACLPASTQTPGAAFIHLGRADGTFKEGFRVWAMRDIAGCTVPDGGSAAICQRAGLTRNGVVGNFDFDGDGKKDLAVTRTNGMEVFAGRAPDDAQLQKPSMACDPVFSLPFITQTTSVPAGLGDLDGDGCDELALRYSDNANRQGVIIAFGFDRGGARCAGRTQPSWVRISGDTETGVNTMRLGVATARAGRVMADNKDYVAITADLYPYLGVGQPTVLLVDAAEIVAKRPASGERLVSILGDGLTPVPILYSERATGFGRALAGGFDVTGDGKPDLVVGAPGANVNGDGTGAVFVFAGGSIKQGPNWPYLLVVGDGRERGSFGQDLSLSRSQGMAPAALGIGAPLSYRSGTANGSAFVLPLDF